MTIVPRRAPVAAIMPVAVALLLPLLFAFGCTSAAGPVADLPLTSLAADDTMPFAIDVRREMPVQRAVVDDALGFWEQIGRLDAAGARRAATDAAERRLADAIAMVIAGDDRRAERLLDSLHRADVGAPVRRVSLTLLTGLLHVEHRWPELLALGSDSDRPTPADRADVRRWATAYRGAPAPREQFVRDTVVFPLVLSPIGVPMVPVEINGRRFLFWLDTGASTTMLAADVALAVGAAEQSMDSLEVATALGRVPARAAVLPLLRVGPLLISSASAMIVRSGAFEVRDRGAPGTAPLKIDGIIGWDVIRRLDIRIDHARGTLQLRTPKRERATGRQRDLLWLGYPVVRFIGADGEFVHLGLDTGLQESFVTPALARRFGATAHIVERRHIGAIGADTTVRAEIVRSLAMNLGRESVVLRRVMLGVPTVGGLVSLDGVLGADLGQRGVVRIDATNGIFRVGPL